ncbi:MAG: Bax inhibitor-1/YccA family protein [Myxococcales bacterium]|nr:Bax inhibitor-1/YccA family protein [Myxococcales bacterium]
MAFEPQGQSAYGDYSAGGVLAQESARVFMQRVYWWMTMGLGLTGITSWVVASNQALFAALAPHFMILMLGGFGIVLLFSFIAQKVSGPVAAGMFLIYAFINGLVFSVLFYVYELGSIASAFFITAAGFAAMSVYGTVTKKNLSAWAPFLFIGLIGIIIAGIVNIFLQSDMLGFVKSAAAVVIFAGLTAYDTQKLRQYHASSGFSSAQSLAIHGALILYLDFINLFLALLRLFGRRR